MNEQNSWEYLDADQSKTFIEYNFEMFNHAFDWGSLGALEHFYIVHLCEKRLSPHFFGLFCKRLRCSPQSLEIQTMLELGRRRAQAATMLMQVSASAELYLIAQSRNSFEQFLKIEFDRVGAGHLHRKIIEQRVRARWE